VTRGAAAGTARSRAAGALYGLAIGDAPGLPAGSVTDDTEQAVPLAELAIEGRGTVDPHLFVARLLSWEQSKRASGAPDLLGPSTKRAFAAIAAGVPVEEAGRFAVAPDTRELVSFLISVGTSGIGQVFII
jgi:ADP-ribosylglycohydrolase